MYQDKTFQRLVIIALILTISTIFATCVAAETIVSVDAPEYIPGDTFEVEINIEDVYELDTGEFHLLFDPNVVDVTGVTAGNIGGMNIGFANERSDKIHGIGIIKATFDISGTSGASGSGSLATVGFEVIGTDGDCSILNISNPNPIYNPITDFHEGKLWDGSTEEIIAKWDNDIVCIGDHSSFDDPAGSDNPTDSTVIVQDAPDAKVTIFVENRDDDDLFVKLYIDEDFLKQEEIKDDDNEVYYEGYRLTEGVHTFRIEWHDHDTGEDYVKTKDCSVSGITAVTLMTDEHTEDDDKLCANVYVKNLDNDALDVYLYIDGVYKKYKSIPSGGTGDYGEYECEACDDPLHLFRIEWFDHNVTYEKIVRSYITGEEAVTLYVDKHTKEDIVSLSEAAQTPVSTISKSSSSSSSSSSSTRTVKEPTPRPTETQTTEMHTDHVLTQDSEESDMKQHISATCTLVAFVSVLFVLMQIRRV